ncbi:hotdog fold thioesterase [Vibrio sp. SS-MA-C1-2]|uniref:hotdog fold thioesterase n=1 Tax=Vibrio sp. SS-MA-C1-2 TaxID=2908646 RepID=UPI001F408F36|nr:hotdog fold thioesterase [Vibrio sp. SS-MA-C1-2]UJF17434.1 hotdog fold thioesterase [Vibrio sp. SS-MA-C1-2]
MANIWKKQATLEQLNKMSENTLVEHIEIEFTELGDNYVTATMPVKSITHQPLGMLHGGASVVLAETLGSVAAHLSVSDDYYCVGLDINANHIRAVRSGTVIGKASPLHIGATTQVWQIEITDERERLISIQRLTVSVLRHKRDLEGGR